MDRMPLKYSELVLEHFRNPRNLGRIEDADAVAIEGSPACGDMMAIYLKVKDNVIEDIKFESYGCAANIASASMLTIAVKGKTLEDAEKLTWSDIVKALGGLPPTKKHCSNLAIDTLRKAIKQYREKLEGGRGYRNV